DSYLSIIANSADFYDILMRTELISRVAKHDNDTINSLVEKKNEIDKQQKKLDNQQKELKEKAQEYAKQKQALSEKLSDLSELKDTYGDSIANLNQQKNSYQNNYDEVLQKYNSQIEVQKAANTTVNNSQTKNTVTNANTKSNSASTTKKSSSNNNTNTTSKKNTTTAKKTTPVITTTPKMTTAKKTTNPPKQTTTTPPNNNNNSIPNSSKVDIVLNYARAMVGGSYVWGGSNFGATDCSGLVMQCYAQVGIYLPHNAAAQAGYGRSVSYNNIMPGDVVFFCDEYGYIYHVGIYAGGGNMIHAENSYTGIVISNLSSFAQYNRIACIKRLL
ncbi:MAG: NlpC/P60 family protein, partial [Oscillospiraceae bacterium]